MKEGFAVKIRSKEEVLKEYQSRYPALDQYFIQHLSEEYDRYYQKLQHMQTEKEVELFFEGEIEKNEHMFKNHAHMEGVEASLSNQYMAVLAAYGLIVFFRDHMLEK